MPQCNRCGEEVEFKPHPKNPSKMVPFSSDGEIHFAKCGTKKEGKSFDSIEDIRIHGGTEGGIKYVHIMNTSAGQRLRATKPNGGGELIAMTEQNMSLINAEPDYHIKLKGRDWRTEEFNRIDLLSKKKCLDSVVRVAGSEWGNSGRILLENFAPKEMYMRSTKNGVELKFQSKNGLLSMLKALSFAYEEVDSKKHLIREDISLEEWEE